jgi:hypothetical protein
LPVKLLKYMEKLEFNPVAIATVDLQWGEYEANERIVDHDVRSWQPSDIQIHVVLIVLQPKIKKDKSIQKNEKVIK